MKNKILFIVAMFGVAGCATIPTPKIDPDRDDYFGIVTEPLVWKIGNTNERIVVPAGFVTDYASIPPGVRIFIGRRGRHSRAAIVHDYLYWSQKCSREQADNLMAIGMRESDVRNFTRWSVDRGLDAGGVFAWRGNRKRQQSGEIRILPTRYIAEFGSRSWMSYRQQLESSGVNDAPVSDNGSYCRLGNSDRVP